VLRLDAKTLWSIFVDDSGRGALLAESPTKGIVFAMDSQDHSDRIGCNVTLTPWHWDQVPLAIPKPLVFLHATTDRPLLADEFTVGRRFRVLIGNDTVLRPDFGSTSCNCPGFGTRLQREGSAADPNDVLIMGM
jgi:hypothetical protein